MENNNLDFNPCEPMPDEVENQETTDAEETPTAVDNEIADAEPTEESEGAEPTEQTEGAELTEAPEEVAAAEEVKEEKCECAEKRKRAIISSLYDYAEIFAVSIIAVIVIFSFCIRLCRVDGHSMKNTLTNDERIIACDLFYTPKQGDIVVFHLVNEDFSRPLVKRVIATEGQTVEINYTDKLIYVDGVLYEDTHAHIEGGEYNLNKLEFDRQYMFYEDGKVYYRATVPEGTIFVLGDNRNNSTDSRSTRVGFVDVDCVLGKAILRLDPFTVFE